MVVLLTACKPTQEAFHFDEVTYSPQETIFKLFAPADANCLVVVDNDSIGMTLQADSIWTATLRGDQKGKPTSLSSTDRLLPVCSPRR